MRAGPVAAHATEGVLDPRHVGCEGCGLTCRGLCDLRCQAEHALVKCGLGHRGVVHDAFDARALPAAGSARVLEEEVALVV
eukprot:2908869-Alexandrium_andersonii.AAC.1